MRRSNVKVVLVLDSTHGIDHLLSSAHHADRGLCLTDTVVSIPSLPIGTLLGLDDTVLSLNEPFRQFPSGNAFSNRLCIHVIDGLPGSLLFFLLFPLTR